MLPYSLEDSLADDVDQLSFAVGARLPSGKMLVSVAAKTRIDAWLDATRAVGLAPQALCSADGVPDVPSTLVLMIQDARVRPQTGRAAVRVRGSPCARSSTLLRGAERRGSGGSQASARVRGRAAGARARHHAGSWSCELSRDRRELAPDGLFSRADARAAPAQTSLQGAYAQLKLGGARASMASGRGLARRGRSALAPSSRRASTTGRCSAPTARSRPASPRIAPAWWGSAAAGVRGRGSRAAAQPRSESWRRISDDARRDRRRAQRRDAHRPAQLSERHGPADRRSRPSGPRRVHEALAGTGRFNAVLESSSQKDAGTEGRMKINGIDK